MPTYAYACGDCGHRFDARQSFDEAPLDACPCCSGIVRRVLTAPVVTFRGSGFYSTDRSRTP
jgi:putative FmdB family regulatory protein